MTTKYTIHSRPAIAGGILAATGATAMLVRDGLETGFSIDHALMPLLVGMTILSAHLAWQAATERKLAAVGLAFLALFGSGLTIYETMGRRAEVRDAKMLTARDNESRRQRLQAEIDDARTTLAWSEKDRAAECAGAPSPIPATWPECRRKTGTVNALKAQIDRNQKALDTIKHVPVDPKGERVAAIASFFGASSASTKAAVDLFEPFLLPLFLELGSIFMFGFGVGHLKIAPPAPPKVAEPEFKDQDLMPVPEETEIEKRWIAAFKETNGRIPTQKEVLSRFPGLPKSTASVWRRQIAA